MIEDQSATWREVKERCATGIARARARLDAHGTSHDDTEFERGRLSAFQEILGLATPPRPMPEPKPGPGIY